MDLHVACRLVTVQSSTARDVIFVCTAHRQTTTARPLQPVIDQQPGGGDVGIGSVVGGDGVGSVGDDDDDAGAVWEYPQRVNGTEIVRPLPDDTDDSGYFELEPHVNPQPVKPKPLGMDSCEFRRRCSRSSQIIFEHDAYHTCR